MECNNGIFYPQAQRSVVMKSFESYTCHTEPLGEVSKTL